MKPSRISLIFFAMSLIIAFSACSRLNVSSDENDAQIESPASETAVETTPAPTPEEEGPPTDSGNVTPQGEATATPAAEEQTGNIREISLSEAGLEPLQLSDLNGKALNPRLQELLENFYGTWSIEDYTNGIDIYNNMILVLPRFTGKVAGNAGTGQAFDEIINELGPCSYQEAGLYVYRTSGYYLAFYGSEKTQYAAIAPAPVKEYTDDFLYSLIEELDSEGFTSLEESVNKLDPEMNFFGEKGSPDGAGYYANSLYGINVSDVEEPIIDVMSNYEGTLYIRSGGNARYSVAFINLDATVLMLKDTLYRCENADTLLGQDGVPSPDGRLKAAYDPEGHFLVRTLDGSIQDRTVLTWSTGEFYWVGSRYLLYMKDETNVYIVDLDDSSLWGESLTALAEIENPGGSGYKILKVESDSITLKDLGAGTEVKIGYSFGEDGLIKFTKR